MKKIILVIFLTLPSISFAKDIRDFYDSDVGKFAICTEPNARRFVKCVNAVLEKGEYQLYGYPFRSNDKHGTSQAFIKK